MALYTQLPIYHSTMWLLTEIVRASHNISREHRYTICQDLKQVLVALLILYFRINRSNDKTIPLAEAREKAVEADIYLRLLSELKAIPARQYAMLIEQLDSVGKQLAAWEKATTH